MFKNIIIIILSLVIIALSLVLYVTNKNTSSIDIYKFKYKSDSLNTKLIKQQEITDSILTVVDLFEDSFKNSNKKYKIIYKNENEINSIIVMSNDSTVKLLADWLSKIDSIRKR